MATTTVLTHTQWQAIFDTWEQGYNAHALARAWHVDERRLMRTLEALDPVRYARVKGAHIRHASQGMPGRGSLPPRCACGCGLPATGHYRVKRGHAARVPPKPRPERAEERRSTRGSFERETHIPDAPKPTLTRRVCLRCEKPFMSWGAGNRLCQDCRHVLNNGPSEIEVRSIVLTPRGEARRPVRV